MSAFTGTGTIIRLVVRRDRIKLPSWIIGIAAFMAINIPAIIGTYGETITDRAAYATATAASLVSRVFGGPINGPEVGSIVLNETFLFAAILVAFMSTLAIVRHTRQNEETGREEMLASGIIGRQATLTAALIIVCGANIVLGGVISLLLIGNDLSTSGSIGTGAALAGIGIVFAGLAAITAQLSGSARGANSLAAAAIGLAFLLRGTGDAIGEITKNDMAISSAWPSWLSPIGWAQQLHPYTEQNWITLVYLVLFAAAAMAVAFGLNAYRDVGLGLLPAKPGPRYGAKRLLSPLGLAWRLQRGLFAGWAVGLLIMGIMVGVIITEFGDLIKENEQVAEIMKALGNGSDTTNIILGSMMSLMALAIAGYAIQALQRMRAEEVSGQLEPVLATNVGRWKWMFSHMGCAFAGIVTLSLILGVSSGIAYLISSDSTLAKASLAIPAALVHIPAILVVAGFAISVFGLLPRLSIAFSWLFFGLCMLMGQFGAVLDLPQWLLNISPFTHTPFVPATEVEFMPVIAMTAIALVLVYCGLISFRNRDITTS